MFFGPLHLFKGTLIRQETWENIMNRAIGIPYMALRNDKEKNITLTVIDREDAEKLLEKAETVLRDHSKANELFPLPLLYPMSGEKVYGEPYFREVQKIADRLEDLVKNTAWDQGELLYFYMKTNPEFMK